jgi:PadR family transcriptional regulator, regulatory protein PadR
MEGANFLKLEELILLAIAGKSEIYGLEIATEIAKASEDKVQLNYGSLYPYLNRLEKKGYISSRWEEENDRKGARRKYYQIADKGTQSLDEATLIRQRLRQPVIITSQSDPVSNLNTSIQLDNLGKTYLVGANLRGANLVMVENLTIEQLHSARNWEQALNIPDDLKPE